MLTKGNPFLTKEHGGVMVWQFLHGTVMAWQYLRTTASLIVLWAGHDMGQEQVGNRTHLGTGSSVHN